MINKRVAMTLFIAAALIIGVAVPQIRVTQSGNPFLRTKKQMTYCYNDLDYEAIKKYVIVSGDAETSSA